MKKVLEISLAGIGFTINEDAYNLLKDYLTRFEKTITNEAERKEVMEDVEARIAEIFQEERKYNEQIIDEQLVKVAISYLGEIEVEPTEERGKTENESQHQKKRKHFYRDVDNKKVGGVCSGIAAYFDADVTLIRIIFIIALLAYGSTLVIYLIIWAVSSPALTVTQKLELKGIPVTAENIRKYSTQK